VKCVWGMSSRYTSVPAGCSRRLWGHLRPFLFVAATALARGALVLARSCLPSQKSPVRRRPLQRGVLPGQATSLQCNRAPLTTPPGTCWGRLLAPLTLCHFHASLSAHVHGTFRRCGDLGEPGTSWVLTSLCRVACRSCASHVCQALRLLLTSAWVLIRPFELAGKFIRLTQAQVSISHPHHIPNGTGRESGARQRSHRAPSPRSLRYPSHVNPDSELPSLFPNHSPFPARIEQPNICPHFSSSITGGLTL